MDSNLPEEKRQKLLTMVQDLESQGKSPVYIQSVVDHVKTVHKSQLKIDAAKKLHRQKNRIPEWAADNPNMYGALGAGKAIYEDVGKPLAHGAGMVGGGMAGTPAGIAGVVGGSTLGYGITKKLTDMVDRQISKLEGDTSKSQSVKQEVVNTLKDLKDGFVMEVAGQGAGKVIADTAGKIAAPFSKKMTVEAKELQAAGKKVGVTFTPADLTQSKSFSLAESLMEKAFGATDIIRDFRLQKQLVPLFNKLDKLRHKGGVNKSIDTTGQKIFQQVTDFLENETKLKGEKLNTMRTQVLARFGVDSPLEQVGLAGKELLKARTIVANERAQELYRSVKDHVPNEFETPILNRVAKNLLKRKKKLPAQDSSLMKYLEWAGESEKIPASLIKELDALPAEVRSSVLKDIGQDFKTKRSWETLQDFTQELSSAIERDVVVSNVPGMKFNMSPKGGALTQLKQAARADMQNAAKKVGGEAWENLKVANAFYGDMSAIYKSKAIRRIAATDPEKIINVGFKPNGITEIGLMKQALGVRGYNNLREGFTNKLLGAGKHEVFKPEVLQKELMKYGDETLKAIYDAPTVKMLKEVANGGIDLGKQEPGRVFLKGIAKKYPDTIVDSIIGSPEAKLQSHSLKKNIAIINTVINKQEKIELGERLFDKMVTKFQPSNALKPKVFANMVDKYGDRVLKEFYPPKKVEQLKKLGKIARVIESAEAIAGNPSGTGQTLITWSMAKMAITNPRSGVVVAMAPKQFAKLYTSEFGMKWLTDGFKMPVRHKEALKTYGRLTALMGYEEYNKGENNVERINQQP
ncbi:MAG: hypothetical protein GY861_20220 [bacterium]|nr:hypothetical protein [bacterium]